MIAALGDPDREALLDHEQAMEDRVRGTREAHPEELGHRLVQVDDQRDARDPQGQPGEDQEVGQGMDLEDGEVPPALGPGHGPAGPHEEGEVFAQVDPQAGTLVALDVQAVDGRRRRARPRAGRPGGGARRPRPAGPAATSDSASRRTRESSS